MPDAVEPDVHVTGRRFMWPRNGSLTRSIQVADPSGADGLAQYTFIAAAVSNAGGLGGLGCLVSQRGAERRIAGFQQLSAGSLNVNYPLWPEPEIPGYQRAMRARLQDTRREWPGRGNRAKRFGG